MTASWTSAGSGQAGWVAFLSSPPGVALAWVLHGAIYLAVLPLLTTTIAHVDANSADLMQRSFALAYQVKNPPLWEWMEFAVQSVLGPGPRSFLVVRYVVMGLLGLAVYGFVLRASGSRLQAAAASYGLLSFYWFAWYFHDSISHSILVALACALFVDLVVRWLQAPSLVLAVLLGLVAGFGVLSKLNFAVLIVGVVATVLPDRDLRPRLLDARLLLSVVIAAALVAPVLLAAAALGKSVVTVIAEQVVDRESGWLTARVVGGSKLLVHYLLFLLPWAIVAWFAFRRGPKVPERPARDPLAERFLPRLAATTAVLTLVAVVLVGGKSVSERYLFPVLLAVPLYVHVAWGRRADPVRQFRIFGGMAVAVVALTLAIRLVNMATATLDEGDNKRYEPFDRLAAVLSERGLGSAFFVTDSIFESGNLMAFLPEARAASLDTQRAWSPRSFPTDGRCVLLFRGRPETEGAELRPPSLPDELAGLVPPDAPLETLRIPWRGTPVGPKRTGVFGLVDLGTGADPCRRVFGPKV